MNYVLYYVRRLYISNCTVFIWCLAKKIIAEKVLIKLLSISYAKNVSSFIFIYWMAWFKLKWTGKWGKTSFSDSLTFTAMSNPNEEPLTKPTQNFWPPDISCSRSRARWSSLAIQIILDTFLANFRHTPPQNHVLNRHKYQNSAQVSRETWAQSYKTFRRLFRRLAPLTWLS